MVGEWWTGRGADITGSLDCRGDFVRVVFWGEAGPVETGEVLAGRGSDGAEVDAGRGCGG